MSHSHAYTVLKNKLHSLLAPRSNPGFRVHALPQESHDNNGNGLPLPSLGPVQSIADNSPRAPILIQTQRGITNLKPPIPNNPCDRCGGKGRTLCGSCRGKGRLNYRSDAMLPDHAWPVWCPSCRASGKWYCEKCMGTGVKRDNIGFRLPHEDDDE